MGREWSRSFGVTCKEFNSQCKLVLFGVSGGWVGGGGVGTHSRKSRPSSAQEPRVEAPIDGFHSIFYHRNWRANVSCDVDINQSAGSMVI